MSPRGQDSTCVMAALEVAIVTADLAVARGDAGSESPEGAIARGDVAVARGDAASESLEGAIARGDVAVARGDEVFDPLEAASERVRDAADRLNGESEFASAKAESSGSDAGSQRTALRAAGSRRAAASSDQSTICGDNSYESLRRSCAARAFTTERTERLRGKRLRVCDR